MSESEISTPKMVRETPCSSFLSAIALSPKHARTNLANVCLAISMHRSLSAAKKSSTKCKRASRNSLRPSAFSRQPANIDACNVCATGMGFNPLAYAMPGVHAGHGTERHAKVATGVHFTAILEHDMSKLAVSCNKCDASSSSTTAQLRMRHSWTNRDTAISCVYVCFQKRELLLAWHMRGIMHGAKARGTHTPHKLQPTSGALQTADQAYHSRVSLKLRWRC